MRTTLEHVSSARDDRPLPPADDICDNNYRPDWVGPCPMGQASSRPQTMLTVLTQTPLGVMGMEATVAPRAGPDTPNFHEMPGRTPGDAD